MSPNDLSEEEMRLALFGSSPSPVAQCVAKPLDAIVVSKPQPPAQPRKPVTSSVGKLRVVLHVTKVYEGEVEVFTYDASTLSTIVAEMDAKKAAKLKKFKYFEVVSIKPI